MNEAVETLLQTAGAALLLDLNELRKLITLARERVNVDNERAKRILAELTLAEAVLDATEAYAKTLIVITREHRQTISGRLH